MNNPSEQIESLTVFSLQKLIDKVDTLQETVGVVSTDLKVMASKVDDFSYRLKKVEERDLQVQALIQKVDVIVQKLEPDVDKLADKQRKFEIETHSKEHDIDTRLAKVENNWGWVVAISGIISGIVVALIQHVVLTIFFK